MDELRSKGLAKMNEVYGWEMPNIEGDPYFDLTVDHLFGTIWNRPGLSMRDKRIMTLTAVTAIENRDLAEIQINADRKSTRLNSSHSSISYAVFCLKKKKKKNQKINT